MSKQVRIPETIYDEASRIKRERDFPTIGEALRHMCRSGEEFDV